MATLVLTVAGGAIGGPIGAAIGATLGRTVDRDLLFKPKARQGPRLTELAVQTSSYGTPVSELFGTMRVAGTVIWSTDLIETRSTEGGGKGQPETTRYSYSASFAVLLSGRTIRRVGRIWADGKLLRGAGGDFKSRVGGFRVHSGGEAQAPDPLIVSHEGGGRTPAHRGCAYAVFEELQLADFGNRIPSLTFEVEADAGPVDIGAIARTVSGGIVTGESGLRLCGFSAYGSDVGAVVATLADIGGCWFTPTGDGLRLRAGEGDALAIADTGVHVPGKEPVRAARSIAAATAAADTVSVSHYDPARDYQAGVQRAVRPGGSGGGVAERIALPAALSAGKARALAEAALARSDIARETRRVAAGWERLDIAPGARVQVADTPGQWRVARWSLEAMVVMLDLVRIGPAPSVVATSSGRVLESPDIVHGPTVLEAFELPPLDDGLRGVPRLGIAAAGAMPGWREAALQVSEDGLSWRPVGATALPAVIGTVAVPPGRSTAAIADRAEQVELVLANSDMALGQADTAALDRGANLAMVGAELLQFAHAEQIDERRWRLSGLWRGRRGTEAAMGSQQPGDRFVLVNGDSLKRADLSPERIGGTVFVQASGVGDVPDPAETEALITGRSVVPPSPVHLRVDRAGDGTKTLRWARRSRVGWRWIDGVDAPLGEEDERYLVTLAWPGGASATAETTVPSLRLSRLAQGDLPVSVAVCQIGSHGLSPAAILALD